MNFWVAIECTVDASYPLYSKHTWVSSWGYTNLRLTGPTCHQLTHLTNHTHPIDFHRLLYRFYQHDLGSFSVQWMSWSQCGRGTYGKDLGSYEILSKFCLGILSWSVLVSPDLSCLVLSWSVLVLTPCSQPKWQKLHKLTESSTFLHLCFSFVFTLILNLYMKPLEEITATSLSLCDQ